MLSTAFFGMLHFTPPSVSNETTNPRLRIRRAPGVGLVAEVFSDSDQEWRVIDRDGTSDAAIETARCHRASFRHWRRATAKEALARYQTTHAEMTSRG